MIYPCIYLLERGSQRKIGKSENPIDRIDVQLRACFPVEERVAYIFPVGNHHVSETKLKRWLRKMGYQNGWTEMLKMDVVDISPILEQMTKIMREDYPASEYLSFQAGERVSTPTRLCSNTVPYKMRKNDIIDITMEIMGDSLQDDWHNRWRMIKNIPLEPDEETIYYVDGTRVQLTNSCVHCRANHHRKSISVMYIPGHVDSTLIQLGSTCIDTILESTTIPTSHVHPEYEGEYIYLARELNHDMLLIKCITNANEKTMKIISTMEADRMSVILSNARLLSYLDGINDSTIHRLESMDPGLRDVLVNNLGYIRNLDNITPSLVEMIQGMDITKLELSTRHGIIKAGEKMLRSISARSIPDIKVLANKLDLLRGHSGDVSSELDKMGYIVMDEEHKPISLEIGICEPIRLSIPAEGKYLYTQDGTYHEFVGNYLSIEDVHQSYWLTCDIEKHDKEQRDRWKNRYYDYEYTASSIYKWHTRPRGDILSEVITLMKLGYKRPYLYPLNVSVDSMPTKSKRIISLAKKKSKFNIKKVDNGWSISGDTYSSRNKIKAVSSSCRWDRDNKAWIISDHDNMLTEEVILSMIE